MNSIILLSAGLSSRFEPSQGGPKALVPWCGQPLIVHMQNILVSTDIDEIIIVLGAHAKLIQPLILKHNKIKVVYNKDYKFGQTSSLQCGLTAWDPDVGAVGFLPVDFPLLQKKTFNILVEFYQKQKAKIVLPVFRSQKGHPPFFDRSLREEILSLNRETGLNTLVHRYESVIQYCQVSDEGVRLSFNTPEELDSLRKKII